MTPAATTPDALMRAKLHALVKARWGADATKAATDTPFPGGAGLRPRVPGGPAVVLVGSATHRSLGGVLAWAQGAGAGEVHVLADASAETCALLARRAEAFTVAVTVWRVEPPALRRAEPSGFFPAPTLPAQAVPFAEVIREAGADPVVEFGVLTGEVLGLEVARVVIGDDGPRLEVGVGSQDRRARREMDSAGDPRAQLAAVVALIRRHRTPLGSAQPATNLAPERWMRAVVVARPDLVGAAWLAPMAPAVPRQDLRTAEAAMAAGIDVDGDPVVVATSCGIDLDVVPAAADSRRAAGAAGARLVLAMVAADAHPRTRQLAALLTAPAEVAVVPAGWKGAAGTL